MRRERKLDLVTLAIAVPLILVIAVGIADLMQLGTAQTNLNEVAQTSAECITTPGCVVKAEANRSAKALGMDPDFLDVNVEGKSVKLAYVFHGYLPIFPSRHFSASATAS
jgi:hypothetical protein